MASYLHKKIFMMEKANSNKFWTGIPTWILIGAVAVLFPIFAFMTAENIHRYKKNSVRLLVEKGSALIRSFEAGAKTGMMGMSWSEIQLQRLLTETAQQPDIDYLLVTESDGTILAHNDPAEIGKKHGEDLDIQAVSRSPDVRWRLVKKNGGKEIFEVFRMFSPSEPNVTRYELRIMIYRCMRPHISRKEIREMPLAIFIGLDMSSISEAEKSDTYHTIMMGLILLFIGCAGIMFLFLAQSYRTAKTSLSRIKAFSDTLVENMPIGLFAIDSKERIASFNHVAGSVLGISSTEVVGKDAEDVLPHELWIQLENPDIRHSVIEREIDCVLSDGKVTPLEVGASLLKDENGTFLGYVVLFKDLTEIRSLRKEIARSQRLASLGSLAAGVAHEIRNPLSSIKGFATYFKERYRDIPEDQQIADIMIQEVDRLNRVVSQLLELARPVSISGKSVDAKILIQDSLKLIERKAAEKKIQIQTDFAPDIGEIFVDQDRISQVLLNLYLNALEAMENGGTLRVGVSEDAEKKGTEIRIADTGAGISKTDLARIFDPYFTTKSSGTGLGLAIVHNILEAHKGQIKIESVVGQGSSVTVFLPRHL